MEATEAEAGQIRREMRGVERRLAGLQQEHAEVTQSLERFQKTGKQEEEGDKERERKRDRANSSTSTAYIPQTYTYTHTNFHTHTHITCYKAEEQTEAVSGLQAEREVLMDKLSHANARLQQATEAVGG